MRNVHFRRNPPTRVKLLPQRAETTVGGPYEHGPFHRAPTGREADFGACTQDCASLVLGYYPSAPPGRFFTVRNVHFRRNPPTRVKAAPYEHGPFHRAPTGREADFGACTQDSASLVLGYYPSAPPGRFFTVRNVHFRRNPPTRVKLLPMNGVLEGCGFPLIRQEHANEWGTVHLRFIQGVTRCASQDAQNDSLYFEMNFRDKTLDMRFAKQVGLHGLVLRMDSEISVEQLSEDRSWTPIPAGPREGCIAVNVLCIHDGASVFEEADGFHFAEGGGAVQRCFAFGTAVAHEGACLDARRGGDIGVGAVREKHRENSVVDEAVCLGEGGMERGLAGLGVGVVYVRTLFQQKLAEAPMAVESSEAKAEVVTEEAKGFALREQKADGADVSVVGAMLNKGDAVIVLVGGEKAAGKKVED